MADSEKKFFTDIADGIHLTVTHSGVVSLWDTEGNARRGLNVEEHEQYIRLKLTPDQYTAIDDARVTAYELYCNDNDKDTDIKAGFVQTIEGFEVLARIDPVDPDAQNQIVVVSNNSSHVLVFRRQHEDGDQYVFLMSWKYTDTAFQVAYAAALSFAVNTAGAVIHKG